MTNENSQNTFDEHAALEELERLREQIRMARARREQKVEEFDAWVRTNRNVARAERIAALEQEASSIASSGAVRSADRGSEPRTQSSAAAAAGQPNAARIDSEWSPPQARRTTSSWRRNVNPSWPRPAAYYAGGAAAIVFIVLVVMWSTGVKEQPPATVSAPTAAAPDPAASNSPPAGGGAVPAAARPLEIELTTTRPVWMRVTVDGERRLEREVPAEQRLTFGADQAIVLRVGDGGGVRLKVGGRDEGLLGRDGQIAVRTLTVKPQ